MSKRSGTGILRIINAFRYSFDGFIAVAKSEEALRQELLLLAIMIPVSFFLEITCLERVLMISSLIFVIIMELINSAIEVVVDRISLDLHPLSKKAKDIGSAVVFFAFVNLIVVWSCIIFKI
jgi:diacylglycerol kinase (ATP)